MAAPQQRKMLSLLPKADSLMLLPNVGTVKLSLKGTEVTKQFSCLRFLSVLLFRAVGWVSFTNPALSFEALHAGW